MRKGILAMEDNDVVSDGAEDNLEASADESEAVAEVTETENDVVEEAGNLDTAMDTVDRLGEIHGNMEASSEEDGGLDEKEARNLDLAVEGLLISLGAPRSKASVFPAMEGFREPKTRAHSTRLALETLGESLKKIWDAIVNKLGEIYDSVVAFAKALFNGTMLMKRRADGLKKALLAKRSEKAGGEINSKRFGALLAKKNTVLSGKPLVAQINKLRDDPLINFNYGAAITYCNKGVVAMLDAINNDNAESMVQTEVTNLDKNIHASIKSMFSGASHEMPLGNCKFSCEPEEKDGKVVRVEVKIDVATAQIPESVTAMSPEECLPVVQAVLLNLDKFSKYEKESGSIASLMKATTTRVRSMTSKLDDEQKAANTYARECARILNVTKATYITSSTKVRSYDMKTCKAALDYVAASLAVAGKTVNYKLKPDDKKA